ncbi:MAG: hypothetical protein HKO65_10830 [Gemmatimonadetes bacterium]|nr:hypothetical protein [Gemmatimonadota bacterium]
MRIAQEMDGFEEVINPLGGGGSGFPWLAILRPDRSIVIDSKDPEEGNIGSPITEWEIDHWNVMMRASVTRITEEEIAHMAKTLAEDRKGD